MIRLAGAAWLIALLAWLPIEDTTVLPALGFATAGVAWLAWRNLRGWPSSALRATSLGTAAGLASPMGALVLMAFKSGLHGHGFAEYTAAQVLSVIQTTPFWLFGGGILGGLAWQFRRSL